MGVGVGVWVEVALATGDGSDDATRGAASPQAIRSRTAGTIMARLCIAETVTAAAAVGYWVVGAGDGNLGPKNQSVR